MGLSYTCKSSHTLGAWIWSLIEGARVPTIYLKSLRYPRNSLLFIYLLLVGEIWSLEAHAHCPSTLFGAELDTPPQGPKDSLFLFAKKRENGRENWDQIPMQIDQVNQEGRLVLPGDTTYQGQLTPTDLMLFSTSTFGHKMHPSRDTLPCSGATIYELSDLEKKRFAYLTQCASPKEKTSFPHAAKFEPERHLLESDGYRYHFNPENYLQFDSIDFRNAGEQWETVARDSRMIIRSDVRRFFTMHFDSKQIESKLENSRLGPIADVARLSFFLRILFFRLDISLSTDVAFFDDAGHIPMMINIPVNSSHWLNPRSGILYTWVLSEKAQREPHSIQMPRLDVETVKKGWSTLAQSGLAFCGPTDCVYKFGVKVGGRFLVMDLTLKRALVERGFFPVFVEDVAAHKDAMDWKIESSPGVTRMGMYFEVSGLPKGGHPWDFWLKLGGQEMHEERCPRTYVLRRIK